MNTGNNLLFLLLGAMLGTIALSGWLSERSIRELHVRRIVPRGSPAGEPVLLAYEITNRRRFLPTFALDLREERFATEGFAMRVAPGETTTARTRHPFPRRGVYRLEQLTLSTAFPFGLFRKERDLELPDEVVVWPRTDRRVSEPRALGRPTSGSGVRARTRPGGRGEFAALRSYRPGDSPRDVHWRSTARTGELVVREYERDGSESGWICLDAGTEPGERAETIVEIAASLAARWAGEGRRFGFATSEGRVEPGSGPAHLERILDVLARVECRPEAPLPRPPVALEGCVLVSATGRSSSEYGDLLFPGEPPLPREVEREGDSGIEPEEAGRAE